MTHRERGDRPLEKKMRERREVREDEHPEAAVFIMKRKVGELLEGLQWPCLDGIG
jgi:hypothetical protein